MFFKEENRDFIDWLKTTQDKSEKALSEFMDEFRNFSSEITASMNNIANKLQSQVSNLEKENALVNKEIESLSELKIKLEKLESKFDAVEPVAIQYQKDSEIRNASRTTIKTQLIILIVNGTATLLVLGLLFWIRTTPIDTNQIQPQSFERITENFSA